MDYEDYNQYMRNMYGFPNMQMPMFNMPACANINPYTDDLERMYPETYRVIYPMVRDACSNVNMPITESMLDSMTNDIYDRVEADGRINIEISVEPELRNAAASVEENRETRQRRPRRRNRFLNDLIRILLLRELLNRRHGFPRRPF